MKQIPQIKKNYKTWQDQALAKILKKYSPDDIFNVDETGLFWQLFPSNILAFKGERCARGKRVRR